MTLFFFNDTATTEIYTLSLHDALPIYDGRPGGDGGGARHGSRPGAPRPSCERLRRLRLRLRGRQPERPPRSREDRKSTRLNSSHANISYAVFCLKKKNKTCETYTERCI